MKNIDYWNYRSLMCIFEAEETPKEKCFEYILLSIANFSEIFTDNSENLNDLHDEPYELYEYLMMENLKNSHKELPKYLDMELDLERYNEINHHIGKISVKKAELQLCGFNVFKRIKCWFELKKLLWTRLTVKDFIGYFFLRMLEENDITTFEQRKVFLKNLKTEFQEFAVNFPHNSIHLNL